jgi:hypothetical protein
VSTQDLCERILQQLRGKLLAPLGLDAGDVETLEIDPHGPRIIIEAKPSWAEAVTIDASPDGVEAALALRAPKGLDPARAEEQALAALEQQAAGLEDYDAAYDPEEGELLIELQARLITHLPNLRNLAQSTKTALGGNKAT